MLHEGVIHTLGEWHSPHTNEELQTNTQSLQSLGRFKAPDTSSEIGACEEIKSQMNFRQVQRCLFLALFPKPCPVCTCGTRGLHTEP